MRPVKPGDKISDHAAHIYYVVLSAKTIDNRQILLAEARLAPKSPVMGYDIIRLRHNGTIPPSEEWGTQGWSYSTLDIANKKYAEICSD